MNKDEALEEPPNSTTDVVEPEKPCGWVNEHGTFSKELPSDLVYSWRPVYAAPPKREWQGLTDAEIEHIWGITPPDYVDKFALPRMIEATLKEKNT